MDCRGGLDVSNAIAVVSSRRVARVAWGIAKGPNLAPTWPGRRVLALAPGRISLKSTLYGTPVKVARIFLSRRRGPSRAVKRVRSLACVFRVQCGYLEFLASFRGRTKIV